MATLQPTPTNPRFQDLAGRVFGRLTVAGYAGRSGRYVHLWACRCSCGKEVVCRGSNLRSGNSRSCGCLAPKKESEQHGKSKTPEFCAWAAMKCRCLNSKHKQFRHYGGRGITVCQRWIDSFEAFLADVGPRPSPKHTLDRFPDNDGNYEPGNVRWATMREQERNRRDNVPLEINGETRLLIEWAEFAGISYSTFFSRYSKGVRGPALLAPASERHSMISRMRKDRLKN